MKPSLRQHLQRQAERLADLDRLLADPEVLRDAAAFRRLGREHTELQGLIERATRHARRSADRAAAEALRREAGDDAEMRAMAEEEIAAADAELARLEAELERLMLPRDPDDARELGCAANWRRCCSSAGRRSGLQRWAACSCWGCITSPKAPTM